MPKLAMNSTVPVQSNQSVGVKSGDFKTAKVACVAYLLGVRRQYPVKVLIAWGEAISGNRELRDWLLGNGFAELGLFVHAMHHQASAREWLINEGFPELMALCGGAEGDARAVQWLRNHDHPILVQMALAADNDDDAMRELLAQNERIWATLALKIRAVKNGIEERHNDWHSFNRD
jgi:hypothetical protein